LAKIFTPLREKFFRHLPVAIKIFLSICLAIPSYLLFYLVYWPFSLIKPLHKYGSKHLFYYDFVMLFLKKLGFKTWIAQIFDHFNAPLAQYFPRKILEKWANDLQLKDQHYYFRNKNTWNFGGYKPKHQI
jgi:hypothetical protein